MDENGCPTRFVYRDDVWQDWLRDHPGRPLPKHICGLSDEEYAEYQAWRVARGY
jgi:hypothetical protein